MSSQVPFSATSRLICGAMGCGVMCGEMVQRAMQAVEVETHRLKALIHAGANGLRGHLHVVWEAQRGVLGEPEDQHEGLDGKP